MNSSLSVLIQNIDSTCKVAHSQAIRSVSKNLTMRNWLIGYYIVEFEQNGENRAAYGDKLIENIAQKLSHQKGMSATSLRLFRSFYNIYPQISQTVSVELELPAKKLLNRFTFSHFIEFLRLDDTLKRTFYEVEAIKGNWSVRELKRQIGSAIYERVGLSLDKKELIKSIDTDSEVLSPQQIIKDPYILEFTGLEQKEKYSENDLETALLNHLQDFLLELGNGFCFESRQKRISIDNEHDRVDLVYYHRILKCHVLIDLKIREFSHQDVGQMNILPQKNQTTFSKLLF